MKADCHFGQLDLVIVMLEAKLNEITLIIEVMLLLPRAVIRGESQDPASIAHGFIETHKQTTPSTPSKNPTLISTPGLRTTRGIPP